MPSLQSNHRPLNSCRNCGATSYGPIIERAPDGALRPNGRYRCTGCDVVFESPAAWRDGSAAPAAKDTAGGHAASA